MPVNTLSRNRDFRYQIGSCNGQTFGGRATQCDPSYESVFSRNLLLVEEFTEFPGFVVCRNSRGQSHSKSLRPGVLNTCSRARPCSRAPMEIVPLWCRAVQTDLQDNSIAGQCSQAFCTSPAKQHSIGQHCGRCGCSTGQQNLANIFEQKRLTAGNENLLHAKLRRFASNTLHPLKPQFSSGGGWR